MNSNSNYRLVLLYSHPAPYTLACLRTLHARYGVQILAVFWNTIADAPFVFDTSGFITKQLIRDEHTVKQLQDIIEEFGPHVLYVSGWMDSGYLKIARYFKKRSIHIVSGLDGQWHGTVRQYIAKYIGKYFLHKCFDTLWVTGDRQAQYARRLGYHGRKLLYGYYCCDWEKFASAYNQRTSQKKGDVFLYIGRYVPEKGLDVLLQAYQNYRRMTPNPWELHCVGAGPLKYLLENQLGVKDLGFVQSDNIPDIMRSCTAFILPSTYEPWGVVIQEAAAAGMIVICSDECGAAVHLVQNRYNGYLFETGSHSHLTECMLEATKLSGNERCKMSDASHELSKQFTTDRWAETLMKVFNELSQK